MSADPELSEYLATRNSRTIRTCGLMSVHNFPMTLECLQDLVDRVDHITLWLDYIEEYGGAGDPELYTWCENLLVESGVRYQILRATRHWNRWTFREELIRSLDSIRPDIVIFPDSDEKMGEGFDAELEEFKNDPNVVMNLMPYKMITNDGRSVQKNPKARHCKVFKWEPGITYQDLPGTFQKGYRGTAIPNIPAYPIPKRRTRCFHTRTTVDHYCYYTPELEKVHRANREWRGE